MFTGIIEEVGTVDGMISGHSSGELRIRAELVTEGTKPGDSIAVNGVCLTVTRLFSDGFTADVMPETLSRSNLGELSRGSRVNLERALPANGRLGGHFVSGHIDGTGIVNKMRRDGNAVWVTVRADESILRLIVEKGSVAIDGISLTVAKVTDRDFSVSIIPHTGRETTLLSKKEGDMVNLENDILGKYIQKLIRPSGEKKSGSGITEGFLRENGFF